MGRKGIAMLIASMILTVSFSGDRVKIPAGNSTSKSETSTISSQIESAPQYQLGENEAGIPELYAAKEKSTNTAAVKTPILSRGGSLDRLQMQALMPTEKDDDNSTEAVNEPKGDTDDIPKTVTVSVKKEIKKSAADNSKALNQRIADYAYTFSKQYRAQKGLKPIPYRYGAEGPNSFDCSGFVGYVYEHFGIYLERTTYEIIHEGKAVSRNDLRPGDLIFPGPGHVQLYIGNGQVVHAPQTGDVVRVAPLPDYIYAVRRIVK